MWHGSSPRRTPASTRPAARSRSSASTTARSRRCEEPTASGSGPRPDRRRVRRRAGCVRRSRRTPRSTSARSASRRSARPGVRRSRARRYGRSSSSSSRSRSTSRSGSNGAWRWPRSLAVVHDVLISVGVYSLFGFEVTPATVIAFLTILGFSLYDTIVVFDKVHENTRRVLATGRATYGDVVNRQHEPGARTVAEHDAVRGAPGAFAAVRRFDPDGCDSAPGLRSRAARRPHHRFVLVDLHRHADPRCAQGARAPVQGAEGQVRQHDRPFDRAGCDGRRHARVRSRAWSCGCHRSEGSVRCWRRGGPRGLVDWRRARVTPRVHARRSAADARPRGVEATERGACGGSLE